MSQKIKFKDIDQSGAATGQLLFWNNSSGEWEPTGVNLTYDPTTRQFTLGNSTGGLLEVLAISGSVAANLAQPGNDDTPVFSVETQGTGAASMRHFVGDSSPSGRVTGNAGDAFWQDNGTLFICQGGTTWTALGAAGATDLQTAYDNGGTVALDVSGGNDLFFDSVVPDATGIGLLAIRRYLGGSEAAVLKGPDQLDDASPLYGTTLLLASGRGSNQATAGSAAAGTPGGLVFVPAGDGGYGSAGLGATPAAAGGIGGGVILQSGAGGLGGTSPTALPAGDGGAGGDFTITAGLGAAGITGTVTAPAGAGGAGGSLTLSGGAGGDEGGNLGAGGAPSGAGGDVSILGGDSGDSTGEGGGLSGSVIIDAGVLTGTGTAGQIRIGRTNADTILSGNETPWTHFGVFAARENNGVGDVNHIMELQSDPGANGETVYFRVGDRDPSGVVSAVDGSVYFRVNGASSDIYLNRSGVVGTTWVSLTAGSSPSLQAAYNNGGTVALDVTGGNDLFFDSVTPDPGGAGLFSITRNEGGSEFSTLRAPSQPNNSANAGTELVILSGAGASGTVAGTSGTTGGSLVCLAEEGGIGAGASGSGVAAGNGGNGGFSIYGSEEGGDGGAGNGGDAAGTGGAGGSSTVSAGSGGTGGAGTLSVLSGNGGNGGGLTLRARAGGNAGATGGFGQGNGGNGGSLLLQAGDAGAGAVAGTPGNITLQVGTDGSSSGTIFSGATNACLWDHSGRLRVLTDNIDTDSIVFHDGTTPPAGFPYYFQIKRNTGPAPSDNSAFAGPDQIDNSTLSGTTLFFFTGKGSDQATAGTGQVGTAAGGFAIQTLAGGYGSAASGGTGGTVGGTGGYFAASLGSGGVGGASDGTNASASGGDGGLFQLTCGAGGDGGAANAAVAGAAGGDGGTFTVTAGIGGTGGAGTASAAPGAGGAGGFITLTARDGGSAGAYVSGAGSAAGGDGGALTFTAGDGGVGRGPTGAGGDGGDVTITSGSGEGSALHGAAGTPGHIEILSGSGAGGTSASGGTAATNGASGTAGYILLTAAAGGNGGASDGTDAAGNGGAGGNVQIFGGTPGTGGAGNGAIGPGDGGSGSSLQIQTPAGGNAGSYGAGGFGNGGNSGGITLDVGDGGIGRGAGGVGGNSGNILFQLGAVGAGTNGASAGTTAGFCSVTGSTSHDDETSLFRLNSSAGSNGAITNFLVGTRDPNAAAISANAGTIYVRVSAGNSGVYINTSAADPGNTWTQL